MRRIMVARLDTAASFGRSEWSRVAATFEPTLTPLSMQLYAGKAAAPLTFHS